MIYLIIYLLIGGYLGFVIAHSINQSFIEKFNKPEFGFIIYLLLTIASTAGGFFIILNILQIKYTSEFKLHWNPFNWKKSKKNENRKTS